MPSFFNRGEPRTTPHHLTVPNLKRTPSQCAHAFLEQAGIGDLSSLYRSVTTDMGRPVGVIERKLGGGMDWRDDTVKRDEKLQNGWLVVERLPGPGGDIFRARVFKDLAGATGEFCLKLKMHEAGDVTFHEIRGSQKVASDAHFQLEFSSPTRRMLMAPVSMGMTAASRLLGV
jgi:hypothetical protein